MSFKLQMAALLVVPIGFLAGCGEDKSDSTASSSENAPPVLRADVGNEPAVILPSELRRTLRANENAKFRRVGNDIVEAELFQSGISSIEALRGLPLRFLDLGMTEVSDISAIKGMPLQTLILENTPVSDLSVIKGMQLEILQLQNTKVTDLSMLAGMPIRELNLLALPVDDLTEIARLPLQTLWVPQTNVTDISPLQGKTMVSLDVRGTKVSSIEALAGMTTLKRLNIAETPIADLSPLKGLSLERITLTPQTITTGMELLRTMPSLVHIQTSTDGDSQSAAQFWQKFDAGVWSAPEFDATTEPIDKADSDNAPQNSDSPEGVKPSESGTTSDTAGKTEESGSDQPKKADPEAGETKADSADSLQTIKENK